MMLLIYVILGLQTSCFGYLMSRSSVDGVPSNLVTIFFNHPQYPLTLEILTTTEDWVVKNYDDGSYDSTLPVSIIADWVLPFLQREIVTSTSNNDADRLSYLLDMQLGWSSVRSDQLAAEVKARSIVNHSRTSTDTTAESATNITDIPAMAAIKNDTNATTSEAASAAAPNPADTADPEYDAETVLAWAFGLICLDCIVACIIGIMICTSSRKTNLSSLLAHPARLHYTVTHSSPESLC